MAFEANIRIDKGIPRPKKIQRRPGPGKLRRNPDTGQVQAIPPDLDPKEVLSKYLSESTTSQIAASYGVTRKSLVAWLRKVALDEWRAVQLVRAHDRKELANEQLEDEALTPDALSLARARELLRSAQYELTSLDPDYRPHQVIDQTVTIVNDAGLLSSANDLLKLFQARQEKVIEAEQPALTSIPLIDKTP